MESALASRLVSIGTLGRSQTAIFPRSSRPAGGTPHLYGASMPSTHEVARIAETVREPMLGAIRPEWWRDGGEEAGRGKSAQS